MIHNQRGLGSVQPHAKVVRSQTYGRDLKTRVAKLSIFHEQSSQWLQVFAASDQQSTFSVDFYCERERIDS